MSVLFNSSQRLLLAGLMLLACEGVGIGVIESASAQKAKLVPQAFAAVQAPEAAVETCHGQSAQSALDCARKRCGRKASRGACFAVTVCEPAGWAGVMGVRLTEVHFSSVLCGAPSRQALDALKAYCLGHTGLQECAIPHVWGPDSKQHKVDANIKPAAGSSN